MICVNHFVLITGLELQPMVEKRLDAEHVFLIGTSSEPVVRMLGQIVFIWLERPDTAQLQNALSAIQHSQFIHRSQVFATMSSGKFKMSIKIALL